MAGDVGKVGWIDITVADATELRDFYSAVVGLEPEDVKMGEYNDFNMKMPASGEPVVGVCHARGSNADIPSGWLIYFIVASVDASSAECKKRGGTVVVGPRGLSGGRFCVIEDPSGAVAALYEP